MVWPGAGPLPVVVDDRARRRHRCLQLAGLQERHAVWTGV